jgi:hypothetical protein
VQLTNGKKNVGRNKNKTTSVKIRSDGDNYYYDDGQLVVVLTIASMPRKINDPEIIRVGL